MEEGALIVDEDGCLRGWARNVPIEDVADLAVVVNGETSRYADGSLQSVEGGRYSDIAFKVVAGSFPRAGQNSLRLMCGERVLFEADITYDQDRMLSAHSWVAKNEDIHLFPSSFSNELSGRVNARSETGRAALASQLSHVKVVLVLFSNRTGSNIVTDILEYNGVGFGTTNEPLLATSLIEYCDQNGVESVDHYLANVIRDWSKNGVCFLKIGWDAFCWLGAEGILQELLRDGCVIWTRRRDKVAQACSYLRSVRTNTFFQHRSDPAPVASGVSGCVTDMVIHNLIKCLHDCHVADARLAYFVDLYSLVPLEVWYEDIVADMEGYSSMIGDFVAAQTKIKLERPAEPYVPSIVKQATSENEAYASWLRLVMRPNAERSS